MVNTHYAEIDGVGTVGSLDKLQFVPEVVVASNSGSGYHR